MLVDDGDTGEIPVSHYRLMLLLLGILKINAAGYVWG